MKFKKTLGLNTYSFSSVRELLAKASHEKSGDALAGIVAESSAERVAAQMVLADLYLSDFFREEIIPYEEDEVTRIICDTLDKEASVRYPHLPWEISETGCSWTRPPAKG